MNFKGIIILAINICDQKPTCQCKPIECVVVAYSDYVRGHVCMVMCAHVCIWCVCMIFNPVIRGETSGWENKSTKWYFYHCVL